MTIVKNILWTLLIFSIAAWFVTAVRFIWFTDEDGFRELLAISFLLVCPTSSLLIILTQGFTKKDIHTTS